MEGPLHSVFLVGNNGKICVGGSAAWFDSKKNTAQLKGKWAGRDNVEQVQQRRHADDCYSYRNIVATVIGIRESGSGEVRTC